MNTSFYTLVSKQKKNSVSNINLNIKKIINQNCITIIPLIQLIDYYFY